MTPDSGLVRNFIFVRVFAFCFYAWRYNSRFVGRVLSARSLSAPRTLALQHALSLRAWAGAVPLVLLSYRLQVGYGLVRPFIAKSVRAKMRYERRKNRTRHIPHVGIQKYPRLMSRV